MCVYGKGDEGQCVGDSGDLYISFSVIVDPLFHRKGANLYSDISLDYLDAILGADVDITTLGGLVHVQVKIMRCLHHHDNSYLGSC